MNNYEEDDKLRSQDVFGVIESVERHFFIGRQREMNLFQTCLKSTPSRIKVLHHFGNGGVGKTHLLNAYERLAKQEGAVFFSLDSQDFVHTPTGFTDYLHQMIELKNVIPLEADHTYTLQSALKLIEKIAGKRKVILALDTYEKMADLDRWFRQVFIKHLPNNVLVVTAGRKPLKEGWLDSAAWRYMMKQQELTDFTLEQTRDYLHRCQVENEGLIQTLWQFSGGNPLTLSLVTLAKSDLTFEHISQSRSRLLVELTERWLREVDNEEVYELIVLAAMFHRFDQQSLSAVLGRDIPISLFHELVSLSFIRIRQNGWSMHDLIRDAIQIEQKHRSIDDFNIMSKRIAEYYYERTIETRSPHDMAQFFYHLRNDFIQSAFFQPDDHSMYIEAVEDYNFHEVEAFFEFKKKHIEESEAAFYNRTSNKTYHFYASILHNKREVELLGPKYIRKMGYDSARLLKNKEGKTIGLSIVVPIYEDTLEYLTTEPVSRAYFARLPKEEWDAFNVPKEKQAGWYIRHLDYIDPADVAAQSYLLHNLFTLGLQGGKIISSSPVTFFQDLLMYLGFKEVPGAVSYDFNEDHPSPTYMLDVSGPKLAVYLKQFTQNVSHSNKMGVVAEMLSLTDREREIVNLIFKDKSNKEIASDMYIAEVTVKKHISRILKKANVKNRSQLIKKIMDLV